MTMHFIGIFDGHSRTHCVCRCRRFTISRCTSSWVRSSPWRWHTFCCAAVIVSACRPLGPVGGAGGGSFVAHHRHHQRVQASGCSERRRSCGAPSLASTCLSIWRVPAGRPRSRTVPARALASLPSTSASPPSWPSSSATASSSPTMAIPRRALPQA